MIRRRAGIELDENCGAFLRARLGARLTGLNEADFTAYVARLGRDPGEQRWCVEALTTHTTSFFRERSQFDWLNDKGVPALLEQRASNREPLTLWSAACSTGQEGYTALMTVVDALRRQGRDSVATRLVGTDISRRVLSEAQRGIYQGAEASSVPEDLAERYLMRSRSGDGRVRIVPELRKRAAWTIGNLAEDDKLPSIAADIVFVRNVLIYFSAETRARVLANVIKRLRPNGYLLVGHAEAGGARHPDLIMLCPSIFMKAG
ncbi:MAG: protein-glutamate O-methyltransferase CheR [Pseudomonadota bacterium]